MSSSSSSSSSSWLSLEQARHPWQVDWWKYKYHSSNITIDCPHPHAASLDRPIFASKEGWLYYGNWCHSKDQTYECHGKGVFLFPNGRLYVGSVERGCCHGRGQLLWLPDAPKWKQEQQDESSTKNHTHLFRKEPFDGRPFQYKGRFVYGEKEDSCAVVTFQDGTTWEGPWISAVPQDDKVKEFLQSQEQDKVNEKQLEIEIIPTDETDETDDEPFEEEPNVAAAAATAAAVDTCLNPYWLTFEEARQVSHGQVAWWKALHQEDENASFSSSSSSSSHPIWYDPVLDWMYYGPMSFQSNNNKFHGKGILYFPNGRLLMANFHHGTAEGMATWFWMPHAPAWRRNVQQTSPLRGHPYVYRGYMHQNVRADPQAVVVLKDGCTTRMGPWYNDQPVLDCSSSGSSSGGGGDWWKDHTDQVPVEKQVNLQQLLAFANDDDDDAIDTHDNSEQVQVPTRQEQTSPLSSRSPVAVSRTQKQQQQWLSLEEARHRSYGQVEWWKCPGPDGVQLQLQHKQEQQQTIIQHSTTTTTAGAPSDDRPVCLSLEEGWMYVGQYNEYDEPHGLGIYYFPNGRVFCGSTVDGRCHGPAVLLWVPAAPFWVQNRQALSVLKQKQQVQGKDNETKEQGVPYIYIGDFRDGEKHDFEARVLLKDGTVRVGPFVHDKPVGDWTQWPTSMAATPTIKVDSAQYEYNPSVEELLSVFEPNEATSAFSMSPSSSGIHSLMLAVHQRQQQQQQQQSESSPFEQQDEEDWLTLEEAQERSHGKIAWWKCPTIDGKVIPELQQHPYGPPDRPVWTNAQGWMYLGGWNALQHTFQGKGVFLFPNGRVFVGHFDHGKWSGRGKLVWLPSAPDWQRNEQSLSVIRCKDKNVGLPYIYLGLFEKGERSDTEATVILKDGTTRIGPFQDSFPVGYWWQDHRQVDETSWEAMEELVSFGQRALLHSEGNKGSTTSESEDEETEEDENYDSAAKAKDDEDDATSTTNSITSLSSEAADEITPLPSPSSSFAMTSDIDEKEARHLLLKETWISFREARARSYGQVEWWKCPGPHGERIEERQHRPDGPSDRPIWLDVNGSMYLGGWQNGEYHGACVICFPDGRVFLGHVNENICSGPSKLIWLPESPAWIVNSDPRSAIRPFAEDNGDENVDADGAAKVGGLPYIYEGFYQNSTKNDHCARVILKDGTTRIGPFQDDRPIGDWWRDHEARETSATELADILTFGETSIPAVEAVVDEMDESVGEDDADEEEIAFKQFRIEKEKRVNDKLAFIGKWLAEEVIGYDTLQDDMDGYARELLDCGLHSGEMIEAVCTPEDVENFHWMKLFHRRRFASYLQNKQ